MEILQSKARARGGWFARLMAWLRARPIARHCSTCGSRLGCDGTDFCVVCAITASKAADADRAVHEAAMRRILLGRGTLDERLTLQDRAIARLPIAGPGAPTSH